MIDKIKEAFHAKQTNPVIFSPALQVRVKDDYVLVNSIRANGENKLFVNIENARTKNRGKHPAQ